jgi:hypothetical protein
MENFSLATAQLTLVPFHWFQDLGQTHVSGVDIEMLILRLYDVTRLSGRRLGKMI